MATHFRNVILEDEMVRLFDELHQEITGDLGYAVSDSRDGSGRDDIWYEYRTRLILACKKGLIEE